MYIFVPRPITAGSAAYSITRSHVNHQEHLPAGLKAAQVPLHLSLNTHAEVTQPEGCCVSPQKTLQQDPELGQGNQWCSWTGHSSGSLARKAGSLLNPHLRPKM